MMKNRVRKIPVDVGLALFDAQPFPHLEGSTKATPSCPSTVTYESSIDDSYSFQASSVK